MAESESGRRSTAGPPSLASLPPGTRMVTVSRLVDGTHRRGGERQHLGRVAPGEVGTFLSAQGPGRYRIACVGLGGRFIRDGAFAVEVGHENFQPQVVRARTSRDYVPEGTPLAAARRRERQAIQRVQALRDQVRIVERENARLRAENNAKEEGHLSEGRHAEGQEGRLRADVERLTHEVADLRADLERRDADLRRYVDQVLAGQIVNREDQQPVGWVEATAISGKAPSTGSDSVEGDARQEAVVGEENAAETRREGSASFGVRVTVERDGRPRGLLAMANVRNAPDERRRGVATGPHPGEVEEVGVLSRPRLPKQ